MQIIKKYFPDLSEEQNTQFEQLEGLYKHWNTQINVISRKDIDTLYERHVLHSLGIAKVIQFSDQTEVLDIGTGGGFPTVPLAIMFPKVNFHAVDSIGKKLKVVDAVVEGLGLTNVRTTHARAETLNNDYYDFVVSRAVTSSLEFQGWVRGKISKNNYNPLKNGILHLKGGDLKEELTALKRPFKMFELSKFFDEEFFETKKVIHITQ